MAETNVEIFIIDDFQAPANIINYNSTLGSEYNFRMNYYGEVEDTPRFQAKDQYKLYRNQIRELQNDNYAIIFLDLNFPNFVLKPEEIGRLFEWFGNLVDDSNLQRFIGLFFLIDLLENSSCRKTIVITSRAGDETRDFIDKALLEKGASRIDESAIVINGHFIQYSSLLTNERWKNNLENVLQSFISRNNEISWYLNPPSIRGNPSNTWFPVGAHEEPAKQPDSQIFVNAVKSRYPRWNTFDYAKLLVEAENQTIKNTTLDGFIPIEYLKDFWGDFKVDSFIENKNFDSSDELVIPTTPVFPFLVAVSRLLDELKESNPESQIMLRLLTEGKDKNNNKFAVVSLGIIQPFSCDSWNLIEKTWCKFLSNKANGITSSFFAKAMRARCIDINTGERIEGLKGILYGVREDFVAIPCFTKEFLGITWKTRIFHLPQPKTIGSQPKTVVKKLTKKEI